MNKQKPKKDCIYQSPRNLYELFVNGFYQKNKNIGSKESVFSTAQSIWKTIRFDPIKIEQYLTDFGVKSQLNDLKLVITKKVKTPSLTNPDVGVSKPHMASLESNGNNSRDNNNSQQNTNNMNLGLNTKATYLRNGLDPISQEESNLVLNSKLTKIFQKNNLNFQTKKIKYKNQANVFLQVLIGAKSEAFVKILTQMKPSFRDALKLTAKYWLEIVALHQQYQEGLKRKRQTNSILYQTIEKVEFKLKLLTSLFEKLILFFQNEKLSNTNRQAIENKNKIVEQCDQEFVLIQKLFSIAKTRLRKRIYRQRALAKERKKKKLNENEKKNRKRTIIKINGRVVNTKSNSEHLKKNKNLKKNMNILNNNSTTMKNENKKIKFNQKEIPKEIKKEMQIEKNITNMKQSQNGNHNFVLEPKIVLEMGNNFIKNQNNKKNQNQNNTDNQNYLNNNYNNNQNNIYIINNINIHNITHTPNNNNNSLNNNNNNNNNNKNNNKENNNNNNNNNNTTTTNNNSDRNTTTTNNNDINKNNQEELEIDKIKKSQNQFQKFKNNFLDLESFFPNNITNNNIFKKNNSCGNSDNNNMQFEINMSNLLELDLSLPYDPNAYLLCFRLDNWDIIEQELQNKRNLGIETYPLNLEYLNQIKSELRKMNILNISSIIERFHLSKFLLRQIETQLLFTFPAILVRKGNLSLLLNLDCIKKKEMFISLFNLDFETIQNLNNTLSGQDENYKKKSRLKNNDFLNRFQFFNETEKEKINQKHKHMFFDWCNWYSILNNIDENNDNNQKNNNTNVTGNSGTTDNDINNSNTERNKYLNKKIYFSEIVKYFIQYIYSNSEKYKNGPQSIFINSKFNEYLYNDIFNDNLLNYNNIDSFNYILINDKQKEQNNLIFIEEFNFMKNYQNNNRTNISNNNLRNNSNVLNNKSMIKNKNNKYHGSNSTNKNNNHDDDNNDGEDSDDDTDSDFGYEYEYGYGYEHDNGYGFNNETNLEYQEMISNDKNSLNEFVKLYTDPYLCYFHTQISYMCELSVLYNKHTSLMSFSNLDYFSLDSNLIGPYKSLDNFLELTDFGRKINKNLNLKNFLEKIYICPTAFMFLNNDSSKNYFFDQFKRKHYLIPDNGHITISPRFSYYNFPNIQTIINDLIKVLRNSDQQKPILTLLTNGYENDVHPRSLLSLIYFGRLWKLLNLDMLNVMCYSPEQDFLNPINELSTFLKSKLNHNHNNNKNKNNDIGDIFKLDNKINSNISEFELENLIKNKYLEFIKNSISDLTFKNNKINFEIPSIKQNKTPFNDFENICIFLDNPKNFSKNHYDFSQFQNELFFLINHAERRPNLLSFFKCSNVNCNHCSMNPPKKSDFLQLLKLNDYKIPAPIVSKQFPDHYMSISNLIKYRKFSNKIPQEILNKEKEILIQENNKINQIFKNFSPNSFNNKENISIDDQEIDRKRKWNWAEQNDFYLNFGSLYKNTINN
ncbi:nnp-1 protein putative nuclear protein 1 nop52 [Anaeramoeba flamelloides]|uniref:Nnp-1 protein putative nuclear protein 1 nop52 n=1 Tax=Anaeramoeba flamelloides TaxID=1746091 RepID=A0AAV7ZBJ6_9EUKA|nr:nnp-1 protein putative nuclear protein 1 nop52 [Anaeramoeba flamelloides]